MRVLAKFAGWVALGLYFAIAAAGGSAWAGFFALACGICAGRHVEPPR